MSRKVQMFLLGVALALGLSGVVKAWVLNGEVSSLDSHLHQEQAQLAQVSAKAAGGAP